MPLGHVRVTNEMRIAEAVRRHGHGTRVYLHELRDELELSRWAFDRAALAAERRGWIVLMRLDAPWEITPEIEAGALHVWGEPRHIAYRGD